MPGYVLATNYKVNSASDHYRLWQRCARQIYFTLHHITDICHWPCVVQSLLERVVHVLVDGPLFTASQPHTHTIQSTSSMYHYECIALCKDISLQRGRFCTRSLASCIPRSSKDRSSRTFFIQVVRGRTGGRLQFSGGGSKMAWLASAFSSIYFTKRCSIMFQA